MFHHQIAKASWLSRQDLHAMFRLRARVFHQRLGWDVRLDADMERDAYDEADPHYLLVRDRRGHICGCMRLLSSRGPNMMQEVFQSLLGATRFEPCDKVWEVSRFALELNADCLGHAGPELGAKPASQALRLSQLRQQVFRQALHQLVAFAHARGIERYVMVTTPEVQALLARLGVHATVLGSGRFGRHEAIALTVALDEANCLAVSPAGAALSDAPWRASGQSLSTAAPTHVLA